MKGETPTIFLVTFYFNLFFLSDIILKYLTYG